MCICGRWFDTIQDLDVHYKESHQEVYIKCRFCDVLPRDDEELVQHMLEAHVSLILLYSVAFNLFRR